MAKQGLENLQKKQNITKTTTSGVKANLPSTAKPNLPSQPSVPSVSDNTVQTLVDNLQPKKQTSVPVRDQYSVASAFKNVPVDSFTGNTLTTAGAATIDLFKNLVNAPPMIAESASRLGYNLLDAPVTDMRSKVTPQEITKSDSGVRGVAHTLAEGLFGVPEQKEQKQDDSLLNAVKQQFASVGDEPVKQITEWTDPWNKTLQGAVQDVDAVSEAYRNAVQPVTDWMANASEQTRNLAEEQYGQYLSPVAHFISDAIGNIAPNVARRLVVGGLSGDNEGLYRTLSDVAMFSGAFAPAYEEAKAKGLSDNEARLDALFRASIETGTEHMSDTFGLVGGQTDLDKKVLTRIANSNMNPFLKYARAVSWSSFGEATEEGASSGLNKLTDSYMYGTPIDPKVTAVDIVKEAFAGFISSAVEALLGGAGTYNRYAQIFERLVQDKSGEVAEDVAKAYKDELRKEFALVWASMTGNVAEGEYYDPVALELISTAQDKMRSLYGEDDEIANMSPFELLQRVDDIVQREIMDMSPEQYEKYRDRVNGTEAPIVTMGTPDGGTYEVYDYIGEKTDDQVRMLDLADRHGQNVILVDSLYGNQNAATLDDGTILISAKAKKPVQTLIFHEMFHALRSDGKWNDLLELAYDARSKEDGFEEWRDNLMATYLPYYGQVDLDRIRELASYSITRDEEQRKQDVHDELIREANEQYKQGGAFKDKIDEEVAADYMERFGNEETIRNMYNRSGDIFDRVYQGIKDAVSLASGKATGEGRTLLEAERLFSKVARQEMREQQRAEQYLLQNGYNFHDTDGTLYSVGYSTADANLANVDREQLINDIVTASKGAITDEKARQFVEDEEVMAMSIKDTALDFEAEPGEEAIKKNTDYPQGTIDLTNNCTKRRAITYMTNRLQEELPDDLFTADDYADIRLIMMDDGRVVACGLCFVEDRRKQLGEIAQTFRDEWANSEDGYLWRTNSSGNRVKVSIGKDLAKRYGVKSGLVTVNDLNMQQVNFGSSDSWHKFQKEHPYEAAAFEAFNNARGQNAGRLLVPRAEYKREILSWSPEKVQSVNDLGGLRIFSFSDFESIHMLDIIQIIEDCAARGVMIQGYTKQPNFAKLVRNTGIKLNRSLIPYGATGLKTVNGRLVLAMNTAEGMDITSEDFIDETDNPNVGNNITGINDKQIHVAMTDDFIHYIIPFHTGKSNEANLRLGVGKWDNYKDYQTDKSLSAEDTKRLALRTSELKAQGMDDTEAYKRAMKELKIKPTAGKMINIYTEVLSDPTVTNVVAFQNKFFEVCYEKGITPRFSQFLDTDANGNFVYTPGYEKMLVDFKLFDRDGNLLKQEVVKPDFERSFMQQIIDDDLKKTEEELQGADYPQELYDKVLNYIRVKHGYEGDYQAYEELKEKIDKNVTNLNSDNESVQGYALSPSVMNSLMEMNVQRPSINDRYSQFPAAMFSLSDEELDQQYFDALNRGDMDEAQRLRFAHASENGYTDRAYHGTQAFGFTEPDVSYSDDGKSFFVTDDRDVAKTYAGTDVVKPISGNNGTWLDNEIHNTEEQIDASVNDFIDALNQVAGNTNWHPDVSQLNSDLWTIASNYVDNTAVNANSSLSKDIDDELFHWIGKAWQEGNPGENNMMPWLMSYESDYVSEVEDKVIDRFGRFINLINGTDTNRGIYDLVINPDNLLEHDAKGKKWNDLDIINEQGGRTKETTRSLADYAQGEGYNGYVLNNVFDDGGFGATRQQNPATVYDLFDPGSQVKSADTITYDDNGNIIPLSQRDNPNKNDIRYSLTPVDPIEPTSNEWRRDHTTDEVKAMYPDLWDVAAEESETRNPTQVKSTISSYRKIYDYLRRNGFTGTILDASSGLGYGTNLGRNEFNYVVDDIEPYPGKDYSPMYTDYSTLDKTYDAIISNAVLNVLPQDQRDALVVKMGQMLNPGGMMFVNVRGDDVLNASSKKVIDPANMEVYISNTGSYQKGFKPKELKAYLEDALGEGYTVKPTKMFGKVAAIVTKDPDIRFSLSEDYNEKFTDRDGIVYINDVNALTNSDWKTIQKAVDKLGYGIGSAEAAKEVFSRYVPEYGFNAEQSDAIRKAFGVAEQKTKNTNPERATLAKKEFGTTGNFNEAGYLLQDGKMLDFSGKREGGSPNTRAMDHRDINRVFDEAGDGSASWFMNRFIDEGNIRLMPERGVTIGEIEPTAAQYSVLKRYIEHVLDTNGDFGLDISNEQGYTIASREYSSGDKASRIINDIKAYFKDGELPYRSQFADFRYSLSEDIPDQANAFPDRVNQNRSENRFLGAWDRESESEDPYAYEEVSPEKMTEPDSYKVLMEDVDEDYEAPDPEMEEVDFYQSLVPNGKAKGGNRVGASLGFNTIEQAFDTVAGRDTEARKILDDTFIKPLYEAKRGFVSGKDTNLRGLYDMAKKLDIWAGTKESAAAQWLGEGYKTEDGKQIPYTLEDLKKDFPNKWQNIQAMTEYIRKGAEDYVPRWNAMLEQVYPDPDLKHKEDIATWTKQVENLKLGLESAYAIKNPGVAESIEMDIANLQRKIDETQRKIDNGDYRVGKRLTPRKNYFHHFNEIETKGIKGLKNLVAAAQNASGKGNIDPELAGKSEWTQPRSRWMPMLQRRGKGEYTADAVKGFAKYIENSEYAIAFDPVIAHYRDEINKIRKATKQTKNANTMIDYLSDYTNHLAGKTSYLDRAARKLLGGEGNRQNITNFFIRLNNRAKSNAVMGNIQSILKQASNLPNGLANVKSRKAWAKGIADWGKNLPNRLAGKEATGAPMDQSVFLNERYFDLNTRDFEARDSVWKKLKGKVSDFSNMSMEILDKMVAEQIWSAAYYEGIEKGVDDPIYYADDLTKRSVAGRGVGEVPYAMDSAVTKFFMPFQVEVNNQWQGLKGMIRNKDAMGLVTLSLAAYAMNGIYSALGLGDVVPSILGAIIDGLKDLFDKDREETAGEVALNTGRRIAGEAVSYMPGTSLWIPAIMSDESSKALFGEADPTRYGTGTVGLSNVAKVAADIFDGDDKVDLMTPLFQLALPSGGRQASRIYNTMQDFNILPSNGWANTPFGGEKTVANGDYSKSGALKYRLPDGVESFDDAMEIAKAFMLGSNATNAAQEYFDNGNKPLLTKERVEKLKENPEVDVDHYIEYLHEANTDGKGGISQREAYKWLSGNEDLTDEERSALWSMTNSQWENTYDTYKPQNETLVENADEDGNGRVTQEEAYKWLSQQYGMTQDEKQAMWEENGWSKSYKKYTDDYVESLKEYNGYTRKDLTKEVDTDESGSMSQEELYQWLKKQSMSEADKREMWKLGGWKSSYDDYKNKESTRASNAAKKELTEKADSDKSGTVTQAEMYAYLMRQNMTEFQREREWEKMGWKTSYSDYKKKHS